MGSIMSRCDFENLTHCRRRGWWYHVPHSSYLNKFGDQLSHRSSVPIKPSAVNHVLVAAIVILSYMCHVWTMYLCMVYVKFIFEAPSTKTLTGVLLFCVGATILWQFADSFGGALIGTLQYVKPDSLSHPSLGLLYVFSLFPPQRPHLQLLPLTSKPFELNLRYLAQRIYGSGEMCSMTFPWPWPKVTAVASISKNLLVCAIKWEPLYGSLQNKAALLH